VATDNDVGIVTDESQHRRADGPLIDAARLGDKEAFAQLINAHRSAAEGLCSRLLRDSEASRDAVQEATLVAWLSLPQLIHTDRFGAWLCSIALNKARQILRTTLTAARAAANLADGVRQVATPEEMVESEEVRTRIRAAIDGLPRSQRETVYLFYLGGLTHREAAKELDITVNARLYQARSNLGRVLIDLQPKEAPVTTTSGTGFVAVRIADVRMSKRDTSPRLGLILLKTADGERYLPIFVGTPEANMLALGLENAEMPRPMTYQFTAGLVEACGARIDEVRITSLVGMTYLATVIAQTPIGTAEVDARPSDALNLAVLVQASITVESSMLRSSDELREIGSAEQRDQLGDLLDRTEIVHEIRDRGEQTRQFIDQLVPKGARSEAPETPS
jgi:RNA polymerase sigma factor (sigma-70 family)